MAHDYSPDTRETGKKVENYGSLATCWILKLTTACVFHHETVYFMYLCRHVLHWAGGVTFKGQLSLPELAFSFHGVGPKDHSRVSGLLSPFLFPHSAIPPSQ